MEISGKVYNIIYEDNETNFKIINLDNSGLLETVKGIFPLIEVGDNIECKGKYIEHKNFGLQFDCESFAKIFPEKTKDIVDYLSTGAIKGIGSKLAQNIVDTFKEDTLEIMYNEPEKLAKIKGISANKAKEIGEEFRNKRTLFKLVEFLKEYSLSMTNINKIYENLGLDSIKIIKENPYILIDILYNVSFKKIDKIAIKQGISINSEYRVIALIKYIMNLYLNNGHTIVNRKEFMLFITKNIELGYEYLEDLLHKLEMSDYLVVKSEYIVLKSIEYMESKIIEGIVDINSTKVKNILNYNSLLADYEKNSKIILTADQRKAIQSINDNKITIITGGPGTGKTTILKFIIDIFETKGVVEVVAPTGKAAKRINELTGHNTSTIHRLLKIGKFEEDKTKITYFEPEKLNIDLLIIDEASMLDIYLFYYIILAIKSHTRLVIIGDVDQLPSVGPGKVLSDLIESKTINTIYLKEIFRQAKTSDIILNAHKVNKGEYIEFKYCNKIQNKESSDLEIIEVSDSKLMFEKLMDILKQENIDEFFKESIILTPTKKGINGTVNLNKEIQRFFNQNPGKTYGKVEFKKNDRVMQIKNNYDLIWKQDDIVGTGVFNGDSGKISKLDNKNKKLQVIYDDEKQVEYMYSELDQLQHAYAITVHKSQGSEFKKVILLLPTAVPSLLTRNILYTAMSRAKNHLTIIGSNSTLKRMVNTNKINLRQTQLKEKLIETFKL